MDYDGQNLRKLTADRSIIMSPHGAPTAGYWRMFRTGTGIPTSSASIWKAAEMEDIGRRRAQHLAGMGAERQALALALSKDGGAEIYTMTMEGNDLERLHLRESPIMSRRRGPRTAGRSCSHRAGAVLRSSISWCGRDRCAPDHLRRIVQCLAHWSRGGTASYSSPREGAVQDRYDQSRRFRLPHAHERAGQRREPMWSPSAGRSCSVRRGRARPGSTS